MKLASVCIDGSKQKQGIHYEETYAPVVSWGTTRFFLILATINNWNTRQIDFVMAFTQALWTDGNYVVSDNASAYHITKRQMAFREFLNKCVYIYIWDRNTHDSIMAGCISNLYPYMNPTSILQTDYKMETSFCTSFSSQIAGIQLFPTIVFFLVNLTDN